MPETKLRDAIAQFYKAQSVPIPNLKGSGIYLSRHDIHHILMGIDTSDQGECEIMAFEGALMSRLGGKSLLPMLFQIKAAIQDNSTLIGFLNCERIAQAWQSGIDCSLTLSEDLGALTDWTVEAIRSHYNITPLT